MVMFHLDFTMEPIVTGRLAAIRPNTDTHRVKDGAAKRRSHPPLRLNLKPIQRFRFLVLRRNLDLLLWVCLGFSDCGPSGKFPAAALAFLSSACGEWAAIMCSASENGILALQMGQCWKTDRTAASFIP